MHSTVLILILSLTCCLIGKCVFEYWVSTVGLIGVVVVVEVVIVSGGGRREVREDTQKPKIKNQNQCLCLALPCLALP
jgi:hypothetical protein